MPPEPSSLSQWRRQLHEIIYEADTPIGKAFDVALLWAILISVVSVLLESVDSVQQQVGAWLLAIEWLFTILFTIEYVLRVLSIENPRKYVFSFYGAVDLLAIVPTYLSLFVAGAHSLIVIRALRLLRVFRILKLGKYVGAGEVLSKAMHASLRKIVVFLGAVLTLVLIVGALMYLIEGEENGFTSIPQSMYWAIVTMTTVGYGDIAPHTVAGKVLASTVMILGYGIIAVPTGIVTVELSRKHEEEVTTRCCRACAFDHHDADAQFCKRCGASL